MNIVLLENLGCSKQLLNDNMDRLRGMGHTFSAFDRTDNIEKLKRHVADADVIMLANMPLPAEVLEAAPNARFIDVAFTGVDHIPLDQARKRDIAISNASGYANDSVAELAVSFMIQLLRDLNLAQERARHGGTKRVSRPICCVAKPLASSALVRSGYVWPPCARPLAPR